MAASKGRYSNDTINDKDSGNDKQILALQPLALTEYLVAYDNGKSWSQMTDEEKKDDTGFKNKFYVHEVWHKKDSENKEVVLGLLNPLATYVNTDYNAMHAAKRKGKLRITKGGVNYIVLNDGGLNTLPQAYFSSNILSCYTNYVKVYCYLKSAYYLATDYFQVDFYLVTTSGGVTTETWKHSAYLIVSDATDPRFLAANTTLSQFVAAFRDIAGFAVGDTMRIKITAHNEEGDYNAPVYKDGIVKQAMSFIQVYYFATEPNRTTTDPTTGTPYAMLLDGSMYVWNSQSPLQGGFLGIMFNTRDAGDPNTVQPSDKLQGASGTAEEAYDKVIDYLPDGWYYGVPYKDYVGTDGLCYLQIYNSGAGMKYYYNNYNPVVPSAYTIVMSLTGSKNTTTQKYEIYVVATVSGTLPSGGITISSNASDGTLDLHSNTPEVIYWSGSKQIPTTGSHILNTTAIELNEGDRVATWNTSGFPVSETSNYVTEATVREVNSTNFPS